MKSDYDSHFQSVCVCGSPRPKTKNERWRRNFTRSLSLAWRRPLCSTSRETMEELFTLAHYRDCCECRTSDRGRVLVAVTRDCPPQCGVTRRTHCPLYNGEQPIAIDCSLLLDLGVYFPSLFQRQAPMPVPITSVDSKTSGKGGGDRLV